MRITYISEHDPYDPDSYSGTAFCMTKGLRQCEDVQLQNIFISTPDKLLPPFQEFSFRAKQYWLRLYKKSQLVPDFFTRRAEHVAKMLKGPISKLQSDVILTSQTPLSAAYLETDIPIVYWSDHVYGGVLGFNYSNFGRHHPDTMWDAHVITTACLRNARLLIFSSQWAARNAVELYGAAKDKIRVVPFGANLDISHTHADVKNMIRARSKKCIKLLFVGKQWHGKGGDIVLRIAKALDEAGHLVEVTLVGCYPNEKKSPPKDLPSYVKCEGFISKKTSAGIDKLKQLYQESHLFFMPSRGEAFGITYCEANAYGVPCIATCVGGIPDVIHDGVNGMKFSLEATVTDYCDYIVNLMSDAEQYEALALSAFNEYKTRLNWQTASQQAKNLITEIL